MVAAPAETCGLQVWRAGSGLGVAVVISVTVRTAAVVVLCDLGQLPRLRGDRAPVLAAAFAAFHGLLAVAAGFDTEGDTWAAHDIRTAGHASAARARLAL